jgi:acetoin utilization deacetylase AcuC-like enzyme
LRDKVYLQTLDDALKAIDLSGVEQIAISAGFDTYYKDPLASLGLTTEGYFRVGERLRKLGLPVFGVLEGGYCVEDLGKNIDALLRGLRQ